DRAIDEPRVPSSELVGAESVPLRGTRPQALDEHVGAVGEAEDNLAAAVVPDVDGERALARVPGEEHRALSLEKGRSPGAGVVAAERLDLDDVRAECREQLRGSRAGQRGRDVDDARAGERAQLRQSGSRIERSNSITASSRWLR